MLRLLRLIAGAAFVAAVISAAAAMFASAQEPKPAPAATTTTESAKSAPVPDSCIANEANFKAEDKRAYFIVALENRCEQRVKCEVFAGVISARGNKRGRATLVLAAKSDGAEARKSYRMRVKVAGGMAQVDYDCKAY
ncbi:MAG TPA: hypothetical protein VFB31_06500 [Pseudolabrys sp.]|nr:hypothetical protein [Pseudolabrys sp.]